MANSLMELYGGGMTGKPTNYQLGGRIARSNLERAVQGEQRELQRKQQEAARKKSRAQGLGTIFGGLGSLAGSLIPIPGLGTALGGAIGSGLGAGLGQLLGESTFRGTNVGEGRFLQQDRGDLQDSIDDFKSSLGERALATGISKFATSAAANLPGIKDELGFGTRTLAPENIYDSGVTPSDLGFLQETVDETITDFVPLEDLDFTLDLPENMDLPDLPATLDLNVPFSLPTDLSQPIDDLIDPITGEKRPSFVGPMLPQMRGGGLLGMMLPQMQVGGMLDPFEIDRFEVGGEGQGAMQNPLPIPPPPPPPTLPPSTVPGYGTAMTIQGALGQLGMQDIANDPRLQQYMSELPQFGMGYAQQLGDIQTSGQQTLRDMRGQAMQAAGQRGFSGSGIGQRQMATSLGDLRTDIARQRRGVIEGFQADLLGAIGDIERSGQFEFGTNLSQDLTTETAPEDILAIANEQNITVQEAEEEYNRQRDRDERRRYGG
jgi:hypothetical protein